MGWSLGFDERWDRDIGYGVPAICDYPGCNEPIDRGLSFVCGSEPYGGDRGCGLYFCSKHLEYHKKMGVNLCPRCGKNLSPYSAKPDIEEWIKFKLTDDSWEEWRKENPEKVEKMKQILQNKYKE